MKKPLFITVGITILLLILGVWIYLFVFGTPKNAGDIFTDFGFDLGNQAVTVVDTPYEENTNLSNIQNSPLKQLTTRPVAGFVATGDGNNKIVRFAEVGTGHIYEINLTTGIEQRITGTTIPRVTSAVFNGSGTSVALSTASKSWEVFVASIQNEGDTGTLSGVALPPGADDLIFINDGVLNFTISNPDGTNIYQYTLTTDELNNTSHVTLRSINTIFNNNQTYIFSKHAPELEGVLYAVEGLKLTALTPAYFGLTAFTNSTWAIVTYTKDNLIRSFATKLSDKNSINSLPTVALKEKCQSSNINPNRIWCGSPIGSLDNNYLKSWYQGKIRSNDIIWEIDVTSGSAELLAIPMNIVGKEIDIIKMDTDKASTDLFFVNKNDNTLWKYDLTTS